jgi:CHAT domain-containing protein/predicted negative regulator of RcsB-dependent stress response
MKILAISDPRQSLDMKTQDANPPLLLSREEHMPTNDAFASTVTGSASCFGAMVSRKRALGVKLLRALCALLVASQASVCIANEDDEDTAAPTDLCSTAATEGLRDLDQLGFLLAEAQVLYKDDNLKLDAASYCSQSVALAERGEFRLSIRAASKALHLGCESKNDTWTALAMRDLAIAYSYAENHKHAAQYAHAALKLKPANPEMVFGPVRKVLGDVYLRRGRFEKAIEQYKLAEQASSARYRPLVRMSLANTYVAAGRLDEARALYDQIRDLPDAKLWPLYNRGKANLKLREGKPAEARALFETASQQAKGGDADYHRLWALDGIARSYAAEHDRTMAMRQYNEALSLAERLRSRFHSEEFKMGLFGNVQDIFDSTIALAASEGNADLARQLSERARSRALLDTMLSRADEPETATPPPPTLVQLQQALAEGQVVVEFHTLNDRVLAWVVRRDAALKLENIALSRDALRLQVDRFRSLTLPKTLKPMNLAAKSDVDNHSRAQLYQPLIAPLGLRDGEHLIIIPHGKLHYLPFQALHDGKRYLIEKHPITIVPSGEIALQLATRNNHPGWSLLAFGNPERLDLPALPWAQDEVNYISKKFPSSAPWIGKDATEAQLRRSIGRTNVLHIAAHANVDSVDPLRSKISLARSGSAERGNEIDGNLEAREIFGLRDQLKSVALVTLSACETGLGIVRRGDEALGFPRAFLGAGATGLIVSQWQVNDKSTNDLMKSFYDKMEQGESVPVALQNAQKQLLAVQPHPYYWAPFNYIGDWRLKLVAGRTPQASQ